LKEKNETIDKIKLIKQTLEDEKNTESAKLINEKTDLEK
jgi:hypothetical protein